MRRAFLPILRLAAFCAFVLAGSECLAQSLGFGIGVGIPLMDYFTGQTDREYRVTPEPGYYPVLRTFENNVPSIHFGANFLLEMTPVIDAEIRFDVTRMGWNKSVVTHVSCTPVDVVNGTFNDSIAKYVALKDVPSECLNRETYDAEESMDNDDLSNLWFFHISGGMRYWFPESWQAFRFFAGAHAGLTIATTIDSDTWLGGSVDAMLGAAWHVTDLVIFEFFARILFMVTQVPQDSQVRINHETQTGGNIFTSLVQPNAYVDFQISIRFDFRSL